MKRIKIMLTAITVLAVVGGALAFKAQKFSLAKICTGTTTTQCINEEFESTFTNVGTPVYYTQINPADNCQNKQCPSSTSLTTELP